MMTSQCSGDDLLKFANLSPDEIEYMSALDLESLLIYLEKKYGMQNKAEMKK